MDEGAVLVDVLPLNPLLLRRVVLTVPTGELKVGEVVAAAEGVVVRTLEVELVDSATWVLEGVDVAFEVVLIFADGLVDDGGWTGFGCDPRIEQPRS